MNQPTHGETCPSEFGLERWLTGELDGSDAAQSTALHVGACVACATRVATLSAPPPRSFSLDAVWQAARGPAAEAPGPTSRPGVRARVTWGRRMTFALTATAAVVAAIILLVRPSPPPPLDLVKGGPWGLAVVVKPQGRAEVTRILSGAHLSPGDRLRFEVSTTWSVGYAAIISIDSAGAISALFPVEGQAIEVRGGRSVLLDGAVELDRTPGSERIELLGCPRPVAVAKVAAAAREALARAGGELRQVGEIVPGCAQRAFWIEKGTP